MAHVLKEVLEEVDIDRSGCLAFREFEQLMNIISLRSGFVKREYESLQKLFHSFCVGGESSMNTDRMSAVLEYVGFLVSPEVIKEILEAVDIDQSGTIDEAEF